MLLVSIVCLLGLCSEKHVQCKDLRLSNRRSSYPSRGLIYHRDTMALPYQAHPIYRLRKSSIIIALIGIVLLCIPFQPPYYGSLHISTFWLAVSAIFCAADLLLYALKKVEKPDDDPTWPKLVWMIGDAVLNPQKFVREILQDK